MDVDVVDVDLGNGYGYTERRDKAGTWSRIKIAAQFDEDGNPAGADYYVDGVKVGSTVPENPDIEPVERNVRKSEQAPGEHGHYSRFTPQPIDIIAAWNLNHWQAEALTYLVRYDMKGGKEDLEKAIWYINDLIKRKYGDS